MKRAILAIAAISAIALVTARGWEHTLTALPHIETRCPADASAVLVIGQSHASNTGQKRHISWSGARTIDRGNCYLLRDPIPGTAGKGGSIWPQFADYAGKPVVIANMAISGSSIDQWTTPAKLNEIRETVQMLSEAGYPDPLVIWMQGETDAAREMTARAYHAALKKLLTAAPDRRWLIMRESICYERQAKWKPIDDARDMLATEHPNVTIGPDLDQLPLTLRQRDKCHLTFVGQDVLARQIAAAATPLLSQP